MRRKGRRQRRFLYKHPNGRFRPLRRRPGRKGTWRALRVPRRCRFRRFNRSRPFKGNTVYALDLDDDSENNLTEICALDDDTDTEVFYYLDGDEDDDNFISALHDLDDDETDIEYDDAEDEAPSDSEN